MLPNGFSSNSYGCCFCREGKNDIQSTSGLSLGAPPILSALPHQAATRRLPEHPPAFQQRTAASPGSLLSADSPETTEHKAAPSAAWAPHGFGASKARRAGLQAGHQRGFSFLEITASSPPRPGSESSSLHGVWEKLG